MLRIGTRGSLLATTQSGTVRDALAACGHPGELTIIHTPGDRSVAPVERIGVGVFTQELRDALLRGDIDVAVHSFKDLPTAADARFHVVTPPREDVREALIARDGFTLDTLPPHARVGTSAPRRRAQLRRLRPDVEVLPMRGNVDTRMKKVARGEVDAVLLAAAGLSRLSLLDAATELFEPEVFMPAPAQGALAVECRAEDSEVVAALQQIVCVETQRCVEAERRVLSILEAGCTAPVAVHAIIEDDAVRIRAGVFACDGSRALIEEGPDPVEVAHMLQELGAEELVHMDA